MRQAGFDRRRSQSTCVARGRGDSRRKRRWEDGSTVKTESVPAVRGRKLAAAGLVLTSSPP